LHKNFLFILKIILGAAEIFTLFNFQSKKFHHRAFRSNLFCSRRKNIHAQKRISTTIAAPNSRPSFY